VIDKKGQQMTLGTLIAIILGIAVLVFLIFGFSTGWGSLWDKITNIGGGKSNLDSIKTGCELACSTNSVSSFCTDKRTVKFGEKVEIIRGTEKVSKSSAIGSCNNISINPSEFNGLRVAGCPGLCS